MVKEKKLIAIFSHTLTDEQIADASDRFGERRIIYLPTDLQQLWSNIPDEGEWDEKWIEPIKSWLLDQLNAEDILVVQGEYGATVSLVSWLQKIGYTPYYTTTKRVVREVKQEDGTVLVQRQFKHTMFRKYPNCF